MYSKYRVLAKKDKCVCSANHDLPVLLDEPGGLAEYLYKELSFCLPLLAQNPFLLIVAMANMMKEWCLIMSMVFYIYVRNRVG